MCLIAYVPKGKSLSREVIDRANQVNPDGIGVMSERGIEKFYGNKQLKRGRNYINALAAEGIPHGVHFRYATHGARGLALCHPFKLPLQDVWVMHNGVIGATSREATEDASDTLLWVNKLTEAPSDFAQLDWWNKIGMDIGTHNKALVMYPDGHFIFLNSDHGVTIEEIWYSNQYSLPDAMKTTNSHFVPARMRPTSYYDEYRAGGTYGNGYRTHSSPGVGYGYSPTGVRATDFGGPFGSNIFWSQQWQEYGYWDGSKFQVIEMKKGRVIDPYPLPSKIIELKPDPKPENDDKKCVACGRFIKDPPHGHLACWCTEERRAAVKQYQERMDAIERKVRIAAGLQEKPAMPSGPTLNIGEHPEEKPAVKASNASTERCEHGADTWENCRECIADLEQDNASEVQRWLADRAGHRWQLKAMHSVLDNPSDRADEIAEKVIYLPKTSEK